MKKFLSVTILLMFSVVVFNACNKKKDKDTPMPFFEINEPDFKIAGHPYIYEPIKFISNYSQPTEMTWNFGDNSKITIAGTETEHSYQQPGLYSVTMSIDNTDVVVTKNLRITSGAERVSGNNRWNFFLRRNKDGYPQNHIPVQQFDVHFQVEIPNDTTIKIPSIPNMRFGGPYTVFLKEVTKDHMVFKSPDELMELSYNFDNQRGGIKIVQVSNDTSWHLDGFADIFN